MKILRIGVLWLAVALLLSTAGISDVQAASPITLTISGEAQSWNTKPILRNGTTYSALRETASALGVKVSWDGTRQTATILLNGDIIEHPAGTNRFVINGYTLTTPVPSAVINGVLMVPVRGLAEALKCKLVLSRSSDSKLSSIDLQKDVVSVQAASMQAANDLLIQEAFSGIALVYHEGQILLHKGYGLASSDKLVLPEQQTRIASITKSITAVAVMQLVEQGGIDLLDKLSNYIPDFPRGEEITIHQLLSHTAGLSSNFTRAAGSTLSQSVEEIKRKPLDLEPGTAYKYSNNGYIVLASIIELVTGEKYEHYLERNMFKPLGMLNTGQWTADVPVLGGYVQEQGKWIEAGPYYSQSGTGSLYSTAFDLLLWIIAFEGQELLSEASKAAMLTSHSERNYGYGWMLEEQREGVIYKHNGSGTGYSTGLLHDPASQTTIILLSNQAGKDILQLIEAIRDKF